MATFSAFAAFLFMIHAHSMFWKSWVRHAQCFRMSWVRLGVPRSSLLRVSPPTTNLRQKEDGFFGLWPSWLAPVTQLLSGSLAQLHRRSTPEIACNNTSTKYQGPRIIDLLQIANISQIVRLENCRSPLLHIIFYKWVLLALPIQPTLQ